MRHQRRVDGVRCRPGGHFNLTSAGEQEDLKPGMIIGAGLLITIAAAYVWLVSSKQNRTGVLRSDSC